MASIVPAAPDEEAIFAQAVLRILANHAVYKGVWHGYVPAWEWEEEKPRLQQSRANWVAALWVRRARKSL